MTSLKGICTVPQHRFRKNSTSVAVTSAIQIEIDFLLSPAITSVYGYKFNQKSYL
jgi:hypothetical protein